VAGSQPQDLSRTAQSRSSPRPPPAWLSYAVLGRLRPVCSPYFPAYVIEHERTLYLSLQMFRGSLRQSPTRGPQSSGDGRSIEPMQSRLAIWSVGHSNHAAEKLLGLLHGQQIGYVVDVRSYPYSRHAPHFNREQIQQTLAAHGVGYVFMGLELGGRPRHPDHLDGAGHALYGEMAQLPEFRDAIERLVLGAREHRLALLCSCGRPTECHRRLLVGRVLCERGVELRHIFPDASIIVERSISLEQDPTRQTLFGDDMSVWRSTRSLTGRYLNLEAIAAIEGLHAALA
jgi:hypothetical protein